jgi:hypothetical protein
MYQADASIGMGGVMLENSDWFGGLKNRAYLSDAGQRRLVDNEVEKVINMIQTTIFPLHGI